MNKTKKTHPDITSKHDIPSSILDKQCINNSDTNIEWGKKKKEKNGSGFHPVNRSILDDESRPRFNVSAMFEEHRWYFKPDRKGHFRHISCSLTIQYRSSAHRHAYSRINIRQIIIHAQYSVNSNVFSILFRVKQSIHRHRTIDSLNSYIQFLKKGKLNKIFNIWYKKKSVLRYINKTRNR